MSDNKMPDEIEVCFDNVGKVTTDINRVSYCGMYIRADRIEKLIEKYDDGLKLFHHLMDDLKELLKEDKSNE